MAQRKYQKAIYLGRFQPMHIEHARIIEKGLELAETIYIIVGSAQESGTLRNPLPMSIRYEVIKKSIPETDRIKILPLDDFKGEQNNSTSWGEYLTNFLTEENILTGDLLFLCGEEDKVNTWFTESMLSHIDLWKFPKNNVSSTMLREAIINKDIESVKQMLNTDVVCDNQLYTDIYRHILNSK